MGLDILMHEVMGKPAWMWLGFLALVALLLAADLGLLHRTRRAISLRDSLLTSGVYIALGLGFGAWVWSTLGRDSGIAWLTGFAVEKALAMDNVFVIAMIFGALAVPPALQHRVLFWGILGVLALRAVMIALGAAMVASAGWVMILFAVFLIVTGLKLLRAGTHPEAPGESRLLTWLRRRLPVTDGLRGEAFVVRERDAAGRARLAVTPLFLALVAIEIADLVFAVDSVPAIFAITTDPFIVYSSNIFAVLGLRALYFALADLVHRFRYLKPALAAVLVFIGGKILAADLLGIGKIPPALSLGVTVGLIAAGIGWSLWRTRPGLPRPAGR